MEVQWGKMEAVQWAIGVSAGSRGRCMEAVVSGLKAGEETAWGTATAGGCKSGRMRRGQRRQGRQRGGARLQGGRRSRGGRIAHHPGGGGAAPYVWEADAQELLTHLLHRYEHQQVVGLRGRS